MITICPETHDEARALARAATAAGGLEALFGGPVQVIMVAAGSFAAYQARYGAGPATAGGAADEPIRVDWRAVAAFLAAAVEIADPNLAVTALASYQAAEDMQARMDTPAAYDPGRDD